MARIERAAVTRQSLVRLVPSHLVGRNPECNMVIQRPSVSGRHAAFIWVGEGWCLRDLGSRNGTYLNRRLLEPAEWAELLPGDEVAFAECDEAWTVIDTHPPPPTVIPERGAPELSLVETGGMFYPDGADQPPWVLFFSAGSWHVEYTSGTRCTLEHNELLFVAGRPYCAQLPAVAMSTREACCPVVEATVANASLTLVVSTNEETAAMEVKVGQRRVTSNQKTHLYLLAYLARVRLSKGNDGGWVETDVVVRELQLRCQTQLAVHVHRCRVELASALSDAAEVIDRSRRGLLRISIPPERLMVKSTRCSSLSASSAA